MVRPRRVASTRPPAASRPRLRGALAGLVLCALAACGGGGDGSTPVSPPTVTPPPVTPPPPAPTASSVTVLAGSGQTVPAGSAVPIAPSVVVRDAQGQPFAGATVQFAVAAGGGTLEGATQTSNAQGVASPTRWTVGAIGAQRITATVGTLAPATIDARIDPATEIFTQSVPTTGGVLRIATPGHPYEGLTLTVPAGTFAAPAEWSLRVQPAATPPALPTGYRAGGPLLEVTTNAPRGGALMTLDVPVRRQPGEVGRARVHGSRARRLEVMPTVARTDTSIRVVTTHLRADLSARTQRPVRCVAPARAVHRRQPRQPDAHDHERCRRRPVPPVYDLRPGVARARQRVGRNAQRIRSHHSRR